MKQPKTVHTQAREMAKHYTKRYPKMGDEGLRVCLQRVFELNPKLHRLLAANLKELLKEP